MSTCAVLFAKLPRPGQVKTRLQPWCGPEGAAQLYRAFVLDSLDLLGQCRAARKVVACAPAAAAAAMRELAGARAVEVIPQVGGNLGERMAGALRWSFAQGAERAVCLGADSPTLPAGYIDQALELLEEREVVLGPSTDGGYYLVGVRANGVGGIFAGVAWSTDQVLAQTLERLGPQSLGVLPVWYDVDTPQAARFLRAHLEALHRAGSRQGAHSLRVLRDLDLPRPP